MTRDASRPSVTPMPVWAKILATGLASLGAAASLYLLLYVGPIAFAYLEALFEGARIKSQYQSLAHFVGVASILGALVLIFALGLIGWLMKRLWLGRRRVLDTEPRDPRR